MVHAKMLIKLRPILTQSKFDARLFYLSIVSAIIALCSCEPYPTKASLYDDDQDEGGSLIVDGSVDQTTPADQSFKPYDYTTDQSLMYDMDMHQIDMNLMCENGQIQKGLYLEKQTSLMQTRQAQDVHGFRRLYQSNSSTFTHKSLKYFVDSFTSNSLSNQPISSILLTLPLKQSIETLAQLTWIESLGQGMGLAHINTEHLTDIQFNGVDIYSGIDKWDPYTWNSCFKDDWQDFLRTDIPHSSFHLVL